MYIELHCKSFILSFSISSACNVSHWFKQVQLWTNVWVNKDRCLEPNEAGFCSGNPSVLRIITRTLSVKFWKLFMYDYNVRRPLTLGPGGPGCPGLPCGPVGHCLLTRPPGAASNSNNNNNNYSLPLINLFIMHSIHHSACKMSPILANTQQLAEAEVTSLIADL